MPAQPPPVYTTSDVPSEFDYGSLIITILVIVGVLLIALVIYALTRPNRKYSDKSDLKKENVGTESMANILHCLTEEFGKYNSIERALLFGSRARGDFSEHSDYDVAVFGEIASSDKARLRTWVEEDLHTLHKVDIVFAADISDTAFLATINEGICFYDKVRKQVQ